MLDDRPDQFEIQIFERGDVRLPDQRQRKIVEEETNLGPRAVGGQRDGRYKVKKAKPGLV